MSGITIRQAALLIYVIDYIEGHGIPPSMREMSKKLGIGTNRGVEVHLIGLEKKGYIAREFGAVRGIKVLRDAQGNKVALRHVVMEDCNGEKIAS